MPVISGGGGGGTFNGGTITGQTTIAANLPTDTPLYVKNTDVTNTSDGAFAVADAFDSNILTVIADNVNEVISGVQVNGNFAVTALTATSRLASIAQTNGKGVQVGKSGELIVNLTTAPPDADLGAGDLALWFDSTNGAAKLMVKAKQADGTVKTAAVALA